MIEALIDISLATPCQPGSLLQRPGHYILWWQKIAVITDILKELEDLRTVTKCRLMVEPLTNNNESI